MIGKLVRKFWKFELQNKIEQYQTDSCFICGSKKDIMNIYYKDREEKICWECFCKGE